MSQILPPGADHGRKIKVAGLLQQVSGFQRKFKTVDEDSHSTDSSVSGEESNSLILLAHYIFWFLLRTKLLSNAGYAAELHKNAQKSYFCKLYNLQFANFSIRPKQVFAFLSNSRYLQKATFDCFLSNVLRNYGKRFGKSRATCGKPQQKSPTILFFFQWRPTYETPPSVTQKQSSIGCIINYTTTTFCSALSTTRLFQGLVRFILFFFPFLSFSFFGEQVSYRSSLLRPGKL